MLTQLRSKRDERGFTLVELLVVIAILGILAGIVTVAASGWMSNSQTNACSTEKSILMAAEEAYYASNSTYIAQDAGAGAGQALVTAKMLKTAPSWYKVTVTGTGATATYTVTKDTAITPNTCT